MIQTMANVRSDVLIPGSSRLPVPADDFRNINGFPASSCGSSSSSSVQQSHQRSAPLELLYTHDLRRALDKSDFGAINRRAPLQTPRSRDHIDERRHDETMTRVLRHGEHFVGVNACRQSDCHPPSKRQPPPFVVQSSHHKRNDASWNPAQGHDLGDVTVPASYPGDDNNEVDDDEEEESVSPPKIAPVGGRILTTIDHPIVKPIPFKPVPSSSSSSSVYEASTRNKGSSQNSSLDRVAAAKAASSSSHGPAAVDDGYASREWQNLSSSSSVSQNSSFPDADSVDRRSAKSSCDGDGSLGGGGAGDTTTASYRNKRLNSGGGGGTTDAVERGRCERSSGSSSSATSSSSSRRRQRRRGFAAGSATPSPSCDSGVAGELESLLREKELELRALRVTMERNETAMMEVYEERRQNWELEMGDAVHEWQLKLRGQQQKSFRTEQSLLLQIFKLQQENKELRQKNLERTAKEPNGSDGDDDDGEELRTKIEGLVLELRQMTMEIDVLRAQLKNAVDEASNRSMELISAQLALKDNEIEIDCKNGEIHRLLTNVNNLKQDLSRTNEQKLGLECRIEKYESNPDSRSSSSFDGLGLVESFKVELSVARKELDELKATLEQERSQWVDEKTKVINYQKHLQLNYVQMARKNKLLEIEVQQMTSELERHDTECLRVTATDESFC